MKRLLCFLMFVCVLTGCRQNDDVCIATNEKWYNQYHVVAHAMGGIDGHDYTNSLEAFLTHYDQGTRVFEIDLQMTTDGKFALVHEWDQYHAELIESTGGWTVDSEFFKENKIYREYTPLLLDDLLMLMQKYCDVVWVLDSKTFDMESTEAF